MKRFIYSFTLTLSLTVFSISADAGRFQAMGILPGTTAEFAQNSVANIGAFCLERLKETPTNATAFKTFTGDIKISYETGISQIVSMQEAVRSGAIEIRGNDSYLGVNVIRKDNKIIKIEFLNESVASEDSIINKSKVSEWNKVSKKTKAALDKGVTKEVVQREKVWKNNYVPFDKINEPDFIVMRKQDIDPNSAAHLAYFKTNKGGSISFFKDTNGTYSIIDTGNSGEDFLKTLASLERRYSDFKNNAISIMLTHLDADHTTGLKSLLKTDKKIMSIILPEMPTVPSAVKKYKQLDELLKSNGYQVEVSDGVLVYTNPSKLTNKFEMASTSSEIFEKDGIKLQRDFIDAKISTFGGNSIMKLYKIKNPKSINQSSIVSRIEHNGAAYLNMGDLDFQGMRELLAQAEKESSIADKYVEQLHLAPIEIYRAADEALKMSSDKIYSEYIYDQAVSKIKSKFSNDLTDEILEDNINEYINAEKQLAKSDTVNYFTEEVIGKIDYNKLVIEYNANQLFYEISEYIDLIDINKIDIKCTVLQWPHHYAMPINNADINTVERFLLESDPETIIITKTPIGKQSETQKGRLLILLNDIKRRNNLDYKVILIEDSQNIMYESLLKLNLYYSTIMQQGIYKVV